MIHLTRRRLAAGRHPDTKPDRVLLQEARGGLVESYEVLYQRHSPVLYSFLLRRSGRPELARCLTERAFAQLGALVRDRARALPTVPLTWLLVTGGRLLLEEDRARGASVAGRARLAPVPTGAQDVGLGGGPGAPASAA